MPSHVLVRTDNTNAPTYSDATTCAGCAAYCNAAWCAELRAAMLCQKQVRVLSLLVRLVQAGMTVREAVGVLRGGRN